MIHATSSALVADDVLRQAINTGELEAIAAALLSHGQLASADVVGEARMAREKLKEKRKRQSQKQRKAHAGAMGALSAVELLAPSAGIDEVRSVLSSAETHVGGELARLDDVMINMRSRLATMELSAAAASALEGVPRVGTPSVPALRVALSRPLSLSELDAATAGFGAERKIGSGGFGDVFMGTPLASLLPSQQVIAVKRAKPGLDLADLEKEVAILTHSTHSHLLPLLVCRRCAHTRTYASGPRASHPT